MTTPSPRQPRSSRPRPRRDRLRPRAFLASVPDGELEARRLLTSFLGVTAPQGMAQTQDVVTFNSDSPTAFTTVGALTGLTAGYTIQALSRDLTSNTVFGLATDASADGQLYSIDPTTAVATPLGSSFSLDSAAGPHGFYAVDGSEHVYDGTTDRVFDATGTSSGTVTATGTIPAAQASETGSDPMMGRLVYGITTTASTQMSTGMGNDSFQNVGSPLTQAFDSTIGLQIAAPVYPDQAFVTGEVDNAGTEEYDLYNDNLGNGTMTKLATLPQYLQGFTDTVAPPYLAVTGIPNSLAAGTSESFTVTAYNGDGSVDTGYAGTVHLTSTDGRAVLPADSTLTNGSGNFSVTLKTAGTQSITATDTTTPSDTGTESGIVVTPASATHYTVTGGVDEVAGGAESITVTALDAYGNTATGYAGTVHFTSTDGQAVLPADSTLTNGSGNFSVTLKTAGTQSITATDTMTPSDTGVEAGLVVTPAQVDFIGLGGLTGGVAGVAGTATVTAYDAYNNIATGYSGTVHFTSTDAQAVLPADSTLTDGSGNFSVTLKTAGPQSVVVVDTVDPSLTDEQDNLPVTPAQATHFTLAGLSGGVAGVAANVTVTAVDAYGNTATGYAGTVHFISTDGQATLPADSTLTSGSGTFAVTLKTAGIQSVTATDTVQPGVSGVEAGLVVTPASATHYTLTGGIDEVAGGIEAVTVTALDAYGNTASGYAGTVHFTSTDPQATLPADATLVNGSGTFAVTLKTAGTRSITAADTVAPGIVGTDSGLVVTAGSTTQFAVTGGTAEVAGGSEGLTVTAEDAFGNPTTEYEGTVHFTSSDGQATLPVDSTLVNGSGTFPVTLKTAGIQSVTATDTAQPSITGGESGIDVAAGSATQFAVTGGIAEVAGGVETLAVTALDAFGNTAVGYSGTVHFTSTDGRAILPADATLTEGVGTFPVTLETAGTESVTVTDTAAPGIVGTDSGLVVTPASATHFAFAGLSGGVAGVSADATVTALDAFGNVATGYVGTVHFTSTDPQATLPADSTLTDGVGTFPITLKTAGIQSVTATDTTEPGVTDSANGLLVTAAQATHFTLDGLASGGAGQGQAVTVSAYDAFGNTADGYSGTVHFTSTDPQAILPADSTLSEGFGSFTISLRTAGIQSVTVADLAQPGIAATAAGLAIAPAGASRFVLSGPSAALVGQDQVITVSAFDPFGNAATGYAGTVRLSSSDPAATLPASATLPGGVGTFHVRFQTPGTQSITATDAADPTLTGTESGIAVAPSVTSPAVATRFVLSGPSSVTTAGAPATFTVTALDAFGNIVTGDNATLALSSTDPNAQLPAGLAFNHGVATFQARFRTAGAQSITVADPTPGGLSATDGGLSIAPGAAARLVLGGLVGSVGGTPGTLTVTAFDAFGNVATGYLGTVHFTSTDPSAVLPADSTLVNGVGTFPVTLESGGLQSVTATDTGSGINGTEAGIATSAMIRGVVYQDLNVDGKQEAGEPGLAGWSLFLDLNHSGAFVAGDPTATTDAGGNFSFPGVAAGSAVVLEAAQQGLGGRQATARATVDPDGSLSIGVVTSSPLAPAPVVTDPFGQITVSDPSTAYVQSLYRAVLGRFGGPDEIASWVTLMQNGMTQRQVAGAIVNSPEHRTDEVAAYYQAFLHRAPDPTAVVWVDALLAGASEQSVVEAILDSPEYQADHPDPAGFVGALYTDVLGRSGDPSGVAGWESALASGASRSAVVADFVDSAEANDQVVEGFYAAYLHRPSESGTSNIWTAMLAQGDSASQVAIGILTSGEFIDDSQSI